MNKDLENMVYALVAGENDKAKEHLSIYFNATSSGILQHQYQTPVEIPATEVVPVADDK